MNHILKSVPQLSFCEFINFQFIKAYKIVIVFEVCGMDETLVCDHSNESYWAVLSCGTVYYAVQGGSNF